MTTQELLTRLCGIGYSLRLEGENVRFKYLGEGEPPPRAKDLLRELRRRKEEVLGYLRSEQAQQDLQIQPDLFENSAPKPWDPLSSVQDPCSVSEEVGPKKTPLKIHSERLKDDLWLVVSKEKMESLSSQGVPEAIYLLSEIPMLRGVSDEELQAVHSVKKVFPGASVEGVIDRGSPRK